MKCFINCSIGLVFLIANFYCMFSVDKSKRKDKFFKTLNLELQNKYTDKKKYATTLKEENIVLLRQYLRY